jgi:CubicO group peptidase (beta-lactamase class C family)
MEFEQVWRSLEDTVRSGRMPGLVAGLRHAGETEVFATGVLSFGSAEIMTPATPFRIASLSKLLLGALAASMMDDGLFDLEDPIDTWVPELANPRVLVAPDAPLHETVPAERPITIDHLLTLTHGLGVIFEHTPLSLAMQEQGVAASAVPPQLNADEYLARVGALPLAHQPGERWMYNMGCDILSALLPRIAGVPLIELLSARIFEPAGMSATGFSADRLPTEYLGTADGVEEFQPIAGIFEREPAFPTLAGGLVSTVPDYLHFLSALADGKLVGNDLRTLMTTDRLTWAQREGTDLLLGPATSWGWEVGVVTSGRKPGASTGSYGWTGGTGTSAFVDPAYDVLGAVFTQRMMAGPQDTFDYFMDPIAESLREAPRR